jgi:cell division protein FtsW
MTSDGRQPIDRWLLLFALLLAVIGMVWVYSATGTRHGFSYVIKQGVSGIIGISLMLAFSQVDLSALKESPRTMWAIYGFFFLLLCAVFFFDAKNGAQRWIAIKGHNIQPSEFFKPFAVLMTSWWMVRHRESWLKRQEAIPKLIILGGLISVPLLLIIKQPDMGTAFLIIFVLMLIVFLGGAPRWIFAALVPVLLASGFFFVKSKPYRLQRVQSFLNPTVDIRGSGYQPEQSLIAVGNGGWYGVGLGGGQQKLNFLPEAHTDFIYAIIGEEAGLAGTSTVLALFVAVLWRGRRIARNAKDSFLRLCASGLTLILVTQALINMSVVLSMVPNKGITLPFISYGGSSLMATFMCLGLLLSISKEARQ